MTKKLVMTKRKEDPGDNYVNLNNIVSIHYPQNSLY